MKKNISLIFIIMFIPGVIAGANNFFVSCTGNYLVPSDSVYRNVYGSGEFYPEIKAGVKIFSDVYAWAGYGLVSNSGKSYPDLLLDTGASKKYLSAGLRYIWKGKFGFFIDAGIFNVRWEEIASGNSNAGSAPGFRLGGGVIYNWSPFLYSEIYSAYLYAADTFNDIDLKLGGFFVGAGVGFRF